MADNLVKFVTGTAVAYAGLKQKNPNTLYFLTDSQEVYKGDIRMTGGVYKAVATLPDTGELNVIYVNTTDGSVSYWDGTKYQQVVKPTATSINGSGDNLTFPTTKAVVDYVAAKIADLDMGDLEGRVGTIETQIQTINGTGEGSIKKALQDAKDYSDSLAPNYAPAEHEHTLEDITDAGVLAGKNQVAEADLDATLAAKVNGKADKANTLAGYGITDAYTKNEADGKIAKAVANAQHLKREIVESLPLVESANENTIYMVQKESGSGNQQYDEYMLINGAFEKIGDSAVDLNGYATETYVNNAIGALDKTDSAVANQYVSAVSQEDGVISVTRTTLPVYSVEEGTANGTVAVNGTNVNVHGLGTAAYTDSSAYATAAQGTLASSALQKEDITTGETNGTISVDGSEVAVKGLGTAAFTNSDAYATATQGALADSALQKADITTGTANGAISVDGSNVAVFGLKSAAYTDASAYEVAGAASQAEQNAKTYAESLLTWQEI